MAADQISSYTLTSLENNTILIPAVHVRVTAVEGPSIEASLGIDPVVIGTSPECGLVIPDARVSRRHCELRITPRGILVRDLGSKNGTFIGDVSVLEAIVTADTTVTLGGSHIALRLG